ncbi:hypothetical protein ElyMa_005202300 [Elysia marginata]|uniref:Uncharacterized protein n=1 Tax=Elysia marginata TaxID=1093978 RepID=A0AAV4JYT9_9GAST|nr:hypothetical protein ElyMa_005202300 [Elysia marginata]
MFKALKLLNQKKLENLKNNDSEGKQIVNPTEIITDHFKSKFRDGSTEDIQPFDRRPRPLLNCITQKEVRYSINNKKIMDALQEETIETFSTRTVSHYAYLKIGKAD